MADRVFIYRGTTFRWDEFKAQQNLQKHGIAFEEAVTVFDDPLLVLEEATCNDEQRDAVIGFSFSGRLLTVVHIEVAYEYIRIISARRASSAEEAIYVE